MGEAARGGPPTDDAGETEREMNGLKARERRSSAGGEGVVEPEEHADEGPSSSPAPSVPCLVLGADLDSGCGELGGSFPEPGVNWDRNTSVSSRAQTLADAAAAAAAGLLVVMVVVEEEEPT